MCKEQKQNSELKNGVTKYQDKLIKVSDDYEL